MIINLSVLWVILEKMTFYSMRCRRSFFCANNGNFSKDITKNEFMLQMMQFAVAMKSFIDYNKGDYRERRCAKCLCRNMMKQIIFGM